MSRCVLYGLLLYLRVASAGARSFLCQPTLVAEMMIVS